MSKIAVKTDYARASDTELGPFAQSVYDALNPNAHFNWEEAVMPKFQTDITTYDNALEKVIHGNPLDTTAKNMARSMLLEDLRMIAMEVNRQGNQDPVILQSSGLFLVKGRSKIGILPKPGNFTVESGSNSGDLLCKVNSNAHAHIYNFYSAPVPAPANIADWRLSPSSVRRINISGFLPGAQYELKCAYQGSETALVFSDSVFIYAQ